MKISFSFRYWVIGFYRARSEPIWHIYPIPTIRITIG